MGQKTLETEIMVALKKTPVRTEPIFKFSTEGHIVRNLTPGKEIEVFKHIVVRRQGEHVPLDEVWRLEVDGLMWVLESVGKFREAYLRPKSEKISSETVSKVSIPSIFRGN